MHNRLSFFIEYTKISIKIHKLVLLDLDQESLREESEILNTYLTMKSNRLVL